MEPPARLVVDLADRSHSVQVTDRAPGQGDLPAGPACVITDTNVKRLYGGRIEAMLAGRVSALVEVEAGEGAKSFTTLEAVLTRMSEAGVERSWTVIAFGGGVVGDLAGLAAALYMRGVPFVQCPTTLLAQVDAAVGGKTAVNLRTGKNLAGVFHQPVAVWVDVSLLDTLSGDDWGSGLGEVAKYGLIEGDELLERLERDASALAARERGPVVEAVTASLRSKIRHVVADERESGVRAHLNLGHTVGHAIELAAWRAGAPQPHGVAVGLGLRAEAELGVELGRTPADLPARVGRLLERLGLPVRAVAGWDPDELLELMRRDKKRPQDSSFTCVVLDGPGRPAVVHDVPEAALRRAIASVAPGSAR